MNENSTIYALRGPRGEDRFSVRLKKGEGCFGWSYEESADLRQLKERVKSEGWDSLSEKELDCYQAFLLDFKENDHVVFINTPEYGKCTLARVTGEYFWRWDGPESDFNHRFPVDTESVVTFSRDDALVHPSIRSRLKLQGRWWRIYGQHENFAELLDGLKSGQAGTRRTKASQRARLAKEIEPLLGKVTEIIHQTHPNTDLEHLLAEIFKSIPSVRAVERRGGPSDRGADLLVHFEPDVPISPQTCVVQVKSFAGKHDDTQAVNDIKRAFAAYPSANMGLIISTASAGTENLENALNELREKSGKPVSLLIGKDVADFVLRFGKDKIFS